MYNWHRDMIKPNLLRFVSNKDGKKEIFVMLLVVYLITTILFPSISLNAPTWVTHYVDNLTLCNATPMWLMVDISAMVAWVQLRWKGKSTTARYFKGCGITLNILFYELTWNVKKLWLGWMPQVMCYGESNFIKETFIGPRLKSLKGKEICL